MVNRNSGAGPSQRVLRVGEQVRHALAEVLQRGEVLDDVIQASVISVTEVRMSPDLKIATAYVSPLGAATTTLSSRRWHAMRNSFEAACRARCGR